MEPTSGNLLLLTVAATVCWTVFVAWAWGRVRRRRWLVRPLLLAVCALTALSIVAVGVNQVMSIYLTWGQVLGDETAVPKLTTEDGAGEPAKTTPGKSRMDQFTPAAAGTGLSLPVYVYLPPGYDQSETIRYPVIMAYAGFPGSPAMWIYDAKAQSVLDAEINAHRMAPTVVLFPQYYPTPQYDSECVDPANGGPRFDTYLSLEVPEAAKQRYRVRTDAAAWGVTGFSSGGYCAINLTMRHPDRFAAGAGLAAHLVAKKGGTGGQVDLYPGREDLRNANSPQWRLENLPPPDVDLWLGMAADDAEAYAAMKRFREKVKAPLRLTTETLPTGGHTGNVWYILIPGMLDWLSARLAAPEPTV